MVRMEGVVKGKTEAQRNVSIGEKIRIYRECANLPQAIFAERVGIGVNKLQAVEVGQVALETWLVMKMAEVLNIGYSDLFEAENDKYYPNIKNKSESDAIFKIMRKRMKETGITFEYIAEKIDNPRHNVANWFDRKYVPSPFNFQNICVLLKITSLDIKPKEKIATCEQKNEVVKEEVVKEEAVNKNDIMANVINACNLYSQLDEIKNALDEIILKAQELKETLERYK